MAVSPDGWLLASGGADGTARLWELDTGRELGPLLGHKYDVRTVAFSPDSELILTGAGAGTMRLWNASGQLLETYVLPSETCWVGSVAFSPVNSLAAAAYVDYLQGEHNQVHLIQPGSPGFVRALEAAPDPSEQKAHRGMLVAFSPDGKYLIVGGESRLLAMWEVETGHFVRSFESLTSHPHSLALSADGQRLVTGQTRGNEALLWDVTTGQIIRKFPGHGGMVNAVAFSPDGRLAVTGTGGHFSKDGYQRSDDNSLRLWDADTGERLAEVQIGQRVTGVAFTPDGRAIVSAAGEPTANGTADLRLWQLPAHLAQAAHP